MTQEEKALAFAARKVVGHYFLNVPPGQLENAIFDLQIAVQDFERSKEETEDERVLSEAYRGFTVEVWRNANETTFFSLTFNTAAKSPSSTPSDNFPDAESALQAGKAKVDKRLGPPRTQEEE